MSCGTELTEAEVIIDSIEHTNALKASDNGILVAGYIDKDDGYGKKSSIIKYSNDLKKIWSLDIDFDQFNTIDQIAVYNENTYITGLFGISSKKALSTNRFLIQINNKGEIITNINLGKSIGRASNFLFNDNKLILAHATFVYLDIEPIGNENPLTVVEIDLKTSKVNKIKYVSNALPKNLVLLNNDIYMVARKNVSVFPVISENCFFKIVRTKEKVSNFIPSDLWNPNEYFSATVVDKNKAVIISHSEVSRDFPDAYIRFDYLDGSGNYVSTKMLQFSDYNWSNISLYSPHTPDSFWAIIKKSSGTTYYVNINYKRKVISEIPTSFKIDSLRYFDLSKDYIYQIVEDNTKPVLKRIPNNEYN